LDRVEVTDYQLLPGDVLLLCNDAAYRAMKGSEMAALVGRTADLNQALHLLTAQVPRSIVMLIRILAVQGNPQNTRVIPAGTVS
jgi:sulfur transfer complex TusBCD TusB component (DsrH family)